MNAVSEHNKRNFYRQDVKKNELATAANNTSEDDFHPDQSKVVAEYNESVAASARCLRQILWSMSGLATCLAFFSLLGGNSSFIGLPGLFVFAIVFAVAARRFKER